MDSPAPSSVPSSAASSAGISPAGRRWTLAAAILGSGMAFIDSTVANVALPAIQRGLDASAADAQWVIEAYALFLSSLLLVGGALGDRFGRRRVFSMGAALFTLASLACALAPTVALLIAARAVQGVGAALLVPGSLSLLSAAYPAEERGAAIGTWSAFSGITAAVGPVVGGFLVDHYSWTWAFLLNLPLGLLLLLMCALKVPESGSVHTRGRVDITGASLATLGLAGVVFALIEAPGRGWGAPLVLGAGLVGLAALLGFVAVEARLQAAGSGCPPMLPLALFRDRNFAATNVLTLFLYAALSGGLYFFPLNLIQVQGYGATAAGAALLPFIAIMFVLSRWTGKLVDRFGPRPPLVVGPAIAGLGFALFALPGMGGSYWTTFFPAVCVLGLGMSITVAPLTTTVMNAVGEQLAGTASGVNNAVSRTAGLLAIAVLGVVLAAAFNSRLPEELKAAQAPPAIAAAMEGQRQKLAGIEVPREVAGAQAQRLHQAVGTAFVAGFRQVMLVSAALALLSALSAWCFVTSTKKKPGDT